MRNQTHSRVRLEIDTQQLMRLMQKRQLFASDFRCCDSKSRCVLKQLLLECSARTISQSGK